MQRYERYKHSSIPWVGELPQHWGEEKGKWLHCFRKDLNSRKQCDNVLSLTLRGVVNNDPDNPEGLVPKDYSTYQIFEKDDLVFKLIDLENFRTSRVGLVHERGIMSSAYLRVQPGKKHNPRYFYYYYFTLYQQGIYNKLGAGVRSTLGPTDLLEIGAPVPSRDEQDRIVAFLNQKTAEIDEAIAKKERLIELLDEQKYIAINNAVTRGLNQVSPVQATDVQWVGTVPLNWEKLRCRYLFREVTRRDRDGSEQKLSVTQKHGLIPTSQMSEHSMQAENFDDFKICHPGDLVLNKYKAHLGIFCAANTRGIITNNYTVFRPSNKAFSPYFDLLFHTKWMRDRFASVVYGVIDGMMPLYTKDFYSIETVCPPLEEQKTIVEFCAEVSRRVDFAIKKERDAIHLLLELKSALIADYITGKSRV